MALVLPVPYLNECFSTFLKVSESVGSENKKGQGFLLEIASNYVRIMYIVR